MQRNHSILKREFTSKINLILDNIIPPILRDSKLFMGSLFWILFKDKRYYFMSFKDKAIFMNQEQYNNYYKRLSSYHIQRETDLNDLCISKIMGSIVGNKVLDIACGSGYLTKKIGETKKVNVTGIDIKITKNMEKDKNIKYLEGNVEHIDFPDNYFDTVVCAHTLEHVQKLEIAVNELKRVTKKRLIIVVPKQREYKYTFDLHLNFFPYSYSLRRVMKNENAYITTLKNEFYYQEDY